MTLLHMDGMYYPTDDILFKWSETHANVAMSTVTRRSGPGSLFLKTDIFPQGQVAYSFPESAATMIMGYAFKVVGTPSDNAGFHEFYPTSGAPFYLKVETDFSLSAYLETGITDTLYGTSAPAIISSNIWSYIEIKITPHVTNGEFIIRVNDSVVVNYSGPTANVAPISRLKLSNSSSAEQYFQDLYLCDGLGSTNNDFLGDSRVDIQRPDAPGTHTDFIPSAGANWQNVDEVDIDEDTTYNKSAVIGDKDSYSMSDISLTGGEIFGIQQQSVVRKDDASIRYGKQLLKSGTTEDVGDELQFNDTYTAYRRIFEEDPDTATTWDETGVNAIESGLTVTA